MTVVGHNAASTKYTFDGSLGGVPNGVNDNGMSADVDFFTVVPINNVTAASFSAAMNNHGIGSDGSVAANFGPGSSQAAFSKQALAAAGFGAGATKVVDGVSFTMPTATAAGDNVMASGQVIPLPKAKTANYIDLLATSTCGTINSSPTIQMTINFADGAYRQTQLPTVPNWTDAAPANTSDRKLAVALPYMLVGTAKDSRSPKLYHLRIATQLSDDNVVSIVMPNVGSNFTNACNTPTLHVLAMSTS